MRCICYRKFPFQSFPMKMLICCKYIRGVQGRKQPVKVEHVLFLRKQCGIQQHNLVGELGLHPESTAVERELPGK